MRGRNAIKIVIGFEEPEVTLFEFQCDRRGIDLCYDRNDMKVMLLVRCEGITLEGFNVQERNDECLSEITHRFQIDEDNYADNYCFIGGAFEFSEDGIDVVCKISEVYSNYVVAFSMMNGIIKRFDNKETVAMLVKQRLE